MKNASVLVQFGLLVIGASLLFFYVRPAFTTLSEKQNTLSEYTEAIEEAATANQLLSNLVSTIDGISSADQEALDTYLPREVDSIAVQRDLKAYVEQSATLLVSLGQSDSGSSSGNTDNTSNNQTQTNTVEGEAVATNEEPQVNSYAFSLAVTGSYNDIKDLISAIEANAYPLHIQSLSLDPTESGSLEAEIELITYEFNNEDS